MGDVPGSMAKSALSAATSSSVDSVSAAFSPDEIIVGQLTVCCFSVEQATYSSEKTTHLAYLPFHQATAQAHSLSVLPERLLAMVVLLQKEQFFRT